MNVQNVKAATNWFQVLQTGKSSQTAIMTLDPGQKSGEEPEAHEKSEQVLLVVDGEVRAQIGEESCTLKKGDIVLIPAGTKHQFDNRSDQTVITFNVYAPAEYPPNEQG